MRGIKRRTFGTAPTAIAFIPDFTFVGGNSKVYGAVLMRLRERISTKSVTRTEFRRRGRLKYDAFEPYYQAAEELYHVPRASRRRSDRPPSQRPYAYPPLTHEPRIQELFDGLKREGHHPFHLPVGILLDEHDARPCRIRLAFECNAFDGYPCLTNGKADAQIICVDPALKVHENLTLQTNSYVTRLSTDSERSTGFRCRSVYAMALPQSSPRISSWSPAVRFRRHLLMLRSGNDDHPNGLANARVS